MIKAGTHYSKNQNSRQAAETAAHGALAKARLSQASAALVFASPVHCEKYPVILERVQQITQARHIIGASASAVITEDAEIENEPAVGVMVIEADQLEFSSGVNGNLQENSFQAGLALGQSLPPLQAGNRLMMLFPDPFSFQGGAFFSGLEQSAGFVPVTGGGASDDGRMAKSYQFAGTQSEYDSVVSLCLSGHFRFASAAAQSCTPFSSAMQITRSEGRKIYEIEHRPAYDILLEALSDAQIETLDEIDQKVFLGLALRDFQTDFSNADYFVSKITDINTQKGILTSIVPVPKDGFLTFAVRDSEKAAAHLKQAIEAVAEELMPLKPAFGFYFNCGSRGRALYGTPHHDIRMIQQRFPGVPILGFNTYGQFAPLREMNSFNHQTGVLVMVAEEV